MKYLLLGYLLLEIPKVALGCTAYFLLNIFFFPFTLDVPCSMVLQDLLKMVSSGKEGYGDSWRNMREKLLWIYSTAIASNCGHLVEMIQVMFAILLIMDFAWYKSLSANCLKYASSLAINFL